MKFCKTCAWWQRHGDSHWGDCSAIPDASRFNFPDAPGGPIHNNGCDFSPYPHSVSTAETFGCILHFEEHGAAE